MTSEVKIQKTKET